MADSDPVAQIAVLQARVAELEADNAKVKRKLKKQQIKAATANAQSPGGTPARHVLAPLSPSSRSQESLQQKYNDALKELDTLKKDWNTERQHWRKFKRWWSKYCKEHGLDPLAADKTSKAPDSSATVYEESPKKEEPKQCRGSILSSSPPGPNAHRFRSLFGDETYDTPAAKEEYARPESPSPQRPMLSAQEYWESRVLVPETQYPYESPPRNTSDAQQYPADAVVSARKADAAPVASTSVEAIPNPPMPVASTSASSVPVASTSTLQGPIASTSAQQPATARKPPSGTQKSSRLTPSGWIQAGKPSTSQKPASSSNKSRNSASQKLFSVKKEETETPLIKRALGVDKGRPDSISKTSPSGSPQDPFAPSQISSARFQKRSSSSVNKRSIPQEADTSMLESPSTTVLLDRSPPKTRISKYLPSFPGLGKPPSPPTNYAAIYAELAEEDAQKRVKPKSRRSDVEPNSEESARKRKRDEVEGKRKKIKVEEEDKGPPSEEFEGQNFVREIRRKRREELEADPLKYKGRGAYARGMPIAGEETFNSRFAINPDRNHGVDFQYIEVVRNKQERKQMHAADCDCCRGFYEKCADGRRTGEKDIEEHRGKISRHRHHWAPAPSPPRYWDMNFPDTQAVEAINAKAREQAAEKLARAEEEARNGGRYIAKPRKS